MKKVLYLISNYFKENKIILIKIVCLFILGICIGVFLINNIDIDSQNKISEYISTNIQNTKDNVVNKSNLLVELIKSNFLYVFAIYILGLLIIGSPIVYLTVAYKGISFGYSISAIIASLGAQKGLTYILTGMLLQNIFIITAIFFISISSINLCKGMITDFSKIRNFKFNIVKHSILFGISCIFIIIASLIQVYISNNLVILFHNFI